MSLETITPPTSEPVSLQEAKAQLNILNHDHDAVIRSLIIAARSIVETRARQTMLTTVLRQTFQRWPAIGVLELFNPPLASVTLIQYVDEAGNTQTLATENWVEDKASMPGRILRAHGVTWPSIRTEGVVAPITITFVAGRTAATLVPEPFRHAMKLLIGHWFHHREEATFGKSQRLEMASAALIDSAAHGCYP